MRRPFVLVVLAVALIAFNLRAGITAVPPLLEELTGALSLSSATASLLTTLPVLCFALAAPWAAYLGRRMGAGHAIAMGLLFIVVGTIGRVLGGSSVLLIGTVVMGVGMTIGNVLVPVVAKRDMGNRAPWLIGVFTAAMAVGATLSAALTVPITGQLGWRGGLSIWVVLAVLALPVWLGVIVRRERAEQEAERAAHQESLGNPQEGAVRIRTDAHARRAGRMVWRHPLAWILAIAMGSQSAMFYSLTTWIPAYLTDVHGLSASTAGIALSVFQVTSIPATLALSWLVRLRPSQGWIGALVVLGWFTTLIGLYLAPQWWLLWSTVGGTVQGAGFALALTLIVLRSADEHVARPLSGMGQLIGYLIGASGPFAVGVLREATGAWLVPGLLLMTLATIQLITMLIGGRDRQISLAA